MQNTADAFIWQVCKNATVGCHLPATRDLFHASHQDMSRGKERGKRLESPLKLWSCIGTHVEKGEAARLEVEGRPVDDVEDDEDDGEGDEHGEKKFSLNAMLDFHDLFFPWRSWFNSNSSKLLDSLGALGADGMALGNQDPSLMTALGNKSRFRRRR